MERGRGREDWLRGTGKRLLDEPVQRPCQSPSPVRGGRGSHKRTHMNKPFRLLEAIALDPLSTIHGWVENKGVIPAHLRCGFGMDNVTLPTTMHPELLHNHTFRPERRETMCRPNCRRYPQQAPACPPRLFLYLWRRRDSEPNSQRSPSIVYI